MPRGHTETWKHNWKQLHKTIGLEYWKNICEASDYSKRVRWKVDVRLGFDTISTTQQIRNTSL